jgi:deazaflavin-dependent oxidoreductase (nitroreductase family)
VKLMASCPLGRWVNSVVEPLARRGAMSALPVGPALVVLETVGRRTHRVRRVPVLALRAGNRVIVGTVRSRSDWFANLREARAGRVWVGGEPHEADVHVDDGGVVRAATLDVKAD